MSLSRKFLRDLLESPEGQERIKAIWDEITTTNRKKVAWHTCLPHDRKQRVELEVEAYNLKDVISFLQFAAAYGVGKPPEEKKVQVNVRQLPMDQLTDEELDQIIDGEAEQLALESGS